MMKGRSEKLMKNKVGFFYSSEFRNHFSQYSHPERPERLLKIVESIQETEISKSLAEYDFEPIGEDKLLLVHEPDHVARVKASSGPDPVLLDRGDTYANSSSYGIARLAAGACISAGDHVISGEIDRVFCCIRPPGHHASRTQSMGFCLFNNIAILTRYLQNRYGLERIAIVDWDVHHGNGTQDIFYDDPSVFYFSIHQHPHYPGSGLSHETGVGRGEGYTLNVPVPALSGDDEFIRAIDEVCVQALENFTPDILLVSAGFDAHADDPLSGCMMSSEGFAALTDSLVAFANRTCSGRLISVLEGGYNLEALSTSVQYHLASLGN